MTRKPFLLNDDDPYYTDDRDPRTTHLSDAEWLKEFPAEVGAIFNGKITELRSEARHLKRELARKMRIIAETETDEFTGWFVKEWLKATDAARIAELENKVTHFQRLLRIADHGPSDWDSAVSRAREIPILEVIRGETHLRRSGRSLVGKCPFHEERTPSFHVYPDQNTFHCFGCQAHGDTIKYVMLRDNLSFKEAVQMLGGSHA